MRKFGCNDPNRQMIETTKTIEGLPIPAIEITTSYGGNLQSTVVNIPKCSVPEIVVNYLNFPKGVPQKLKWTFYDDLE
jgi:hypothetical protein